jgi:ribosomal protein S18 acetylase RimI-like enzyme
MDTVSIISQVYDINCFYASFGFTKKYSRTWFLKVYGSNMLIVALNKPLDKVVGFACAYKIKSMPQYINLAVLCVHKDFTRKKVGTTLIKKFKEKFKNQSIVLNVRATNTVGLAFYKSCGFEKIGKNEDPLIMIIK